MLSFYLVGIFSIILSLLVSVLFYINKNIKTFIDIENNNIKSYLQLFGVLFGITFVLLFIFILSKTLPGQSLPIVYTGEPGF